MIGSKLIAGAAMAAALAIPAAAQAAPRHLITGPMKTLINRAANDEGGGTAADQIPDRCETLYSTGSQSQVLATFNHHKGEAGLGEWWFKLITDHSRGCDYQGGWAILDLYPTIWSSHLDLVVEGGATPPGFVPAGVPASIWRSLNG